MWFAVVAGCIVLLDCIGKRFTLIRVFFSLIYFPCSAKRRYVPTGIFTSVLLLFTVNVLNLFIFRYNVLLSNLIPSNTNCNLILCQTNMSLIRYRLRVREIDHFSLPIYITLIVMWPSGPRVIHYITLLNTAYIKFHNITSINLLLFIRNRLKKLFDKPKMLHYNVSKTVSVQYNHFKCRLDCFHKYLLYEL